jgi:formylglycine-generating enzyme required for sulfatase activity
MPELAGLTGGDAGGDATLPGVDAASDGPPPDGSDGATASDASDASPILDGAACVSLHGPTMVRIGANCIDSTEVTYAQYRDFVNANPDASAVARPAECAGNTSIAPKNGFPVGKDGYPVAYVDWCDAWSYCKWAGKELCGTPDGGATPPAGVTDPAQSVWMNACSHAGTKLFPYGLTYEAGACNFQQPDGSNQGAFPPGSFPACVGGYDGIVDMVGNIKEWENSCTSSGTDAAADPCQRRGGGFDSNGASGNCAYPEVDPRSYASSTTGFRCCGR